VQEEPEYRRRGSGSTVQTFKFPAVSAAGIPAHLHLPQLGVEVFAGEIRDVVRHARPQLETWQENYPSWEEEIAREQLEQDSPILSWEY